MANDYKESSSRLLRNFERLEEMFLKLQEGNSNLRVQISDLRSELEKARAENLKLTKENENLKIAGVIAGGDGDKKNIAKVKLAKIINDLDSCIAKLP